MKFKKGEAKDTLNIFEEKKIVMSASGERKSVDGMCW